jgi:hypothetical protein
MKIKQSNKNKAGKIFSTTSGSTLREKTPNQALQPTQKPLRAFWSPELPRCLQKGLKMKRIAIIAIFLMVAVAVKAEDTSLSQVAERLSKIAEQMKPVALVVQNGRNVTLSYNTRTFMVHSSDKLGRRSDKAPAEIPQDLRGPYWVNATQHVSISYGWFMSLWAMGATQVLQRSLRTYACIKALLDNICQCVPHCKRKAAPSRQHIVWIKNRPVMVLG